MKIQVVSLLLTLSLCHGAEVSPIGKVIQLLDDMEQKIMKEGEKSQKVFTEFADYCETRSKDLQHSIQTGKDESAELQAHIEKETSKAAALNVKLEELGSTLATASGDLDAATKVRANEAKAFAKKNADMVDVVSTLERAKGILEREMSKGSAAFMQLNQAGSVVKAFQVMIEASMVSSADGARLTALIQNSDSQSDVGAPDAAVYESKSGGIVGVIADLLDKAEQEHEDLRKAETQSIHEFERLKQSLEDQIKFAKKDQAEAKANLGASSESKASAEGDLANTKKGLAEDTKDLDDLHHECMTKSQEYEAEVKSRGEELSALAQAKKIIKEATSGAEGFQYSFAQIATKSSVPLEAIRVIRDVAKKSQDVMLTQFSLRMASMLRGGEAGPFDKVVGLIKDMIAKLEDEAGKDATEKAYCDKETAETKAKQDEKNAAIAKLNTKIDQMNARSAQLKNEVADLNKQLANLAKSQAEMNKIRAEEKEAYAQNKNDLELGVDGVKRALQVLRDYYGKQDKAHGAAEGAGANIIGLLEVCESDFSKSLAQVVASEESSAADYDKITKENEIALTTKKQDVKYKSKEITALSKSVSEHSSDRQEEQAQLDAVNDYMAQLNARCVAKAETYEERTSRRKAEIAGLKEALSILSDTSFVQVKAKRSFRGSVISA